jgi:hypothetical protein
MGLENKLPTHQQLANDGKLGRRKPFCKNVGALFLGTDVDRHNAFVFPNVGTEEVVLEGKVFVAGQHFEYLDKGETTLVVFKDNGANNAVADGREGEFVGKFL